MKKLYYILFIVALFFFSQTFQEYVVVNGIIYGLIAGLIIAFLAKLIFSVVTKTVLFLAVVAAIVAFLVASGILEVPAFFQGFLG